MVELEGKPIFSQSMAPHAFKHAGSKLNWIQIICTIYNISQLHATTYSPWLYICTTPTAYIMPFSKVYTVNSVHIYNASCANITICVITARAPVVWP